MEDETKLVRITELIYNKVMLMNAWTLKTFTVGRITQYIFIFVVT